MPATNADSGISLPQQLGDATIGWWEVGESEAELRGLYAERHCEARCGGIPAFASEKRTREWIATRLLFSLLCPEGELSALPGGAPFIKNQPSRRVSISHSGNFACIALTGHKSGACDNTKIGIDIECHSAKAFRLKDRFLNRDDRFPAADEKMATVAWSAKETAYKLAGMAGLSLQEGITLCSCNEREQTIYCRISPQEKANEFSCKILYNVFPSFVLTFSEG